MRIAYFDCFSGISGDMTLAALLACGADEAEFRKRLVGLGDLGYELLTQKVMKSGIEAVDVTVQLHENDKGHARHLSDIAQIIEGSQLPERVKQRAQAVFTRLADAEASIHGVTREDIHFHEVGAVDAIVDIVGSCILLDMFDVERIACSKLPWSTGFVDCQHGLMPLPAPATVKLLEGFPVVPSDIRGELITPTGAAILAALGDRGSMGSLPAMTIVASGFGAGKKQFSTETPNLLRVVIGDETETQSNLAARTSTVAVIDTNIDDMSPELYDYFIEKAFAAGALDVSLSSVQMKKNRPGTLVTVICLEADTNKLCDVILRETSSYGVRYRIEKRTILDREFRSVVTPFGAVAVKLGLRNGIVIKAVPEYEECVAIARSLGVSLQAVFAAANNAASQFVSIQSS